MHQVHNDRVSSADAAAERCLVLVKHAGSVHGPGSEPQRQRPQALSSTLAALEMLQPRTFGS